MAVALVTTITNNYIPALKVLIASIMKNTSKNFDIVVIEEEPITEETKQHFKKFNNVIFKANLFNAPYVKNDGRRAWNIKTSNRFSIFLLAEYDKIIFLDADMICYSNIDEIVDNEVKFGAVYHPYPDGYNSKILFDGNNNYRDFNYRNAFNAGLMIIDKCFLNINVVNALLDISSKHAWLGNQGPLNIYFNNKVTLLPSHYFLSTPFIKNIDNIDKIKFLHFGGNKKPWLNSSLDIRENYSKFVINSVKDGVLLYRILLRYRKLLKEVE